ncbi:ABC transporter substrate-binding protein [Plantibacter sp. YIM 135347]|uniref:ABC transporter substrate-binding protein n=1 Tax=Plantibacter sp. YIM 135347 TaxID=3423919 RepID=UPI003D33E633
MPRSPQSPALTRVVRTLSAGIGVVLSAALLSACGTSAGASTSADVPMHTIETTYGTVEVPVAPKRVVAASYDTPWQLMSLGVTPAGTQDYGKWIKEFTTAQQDFVKGVPTIGSYGETKFEAIAAIKPDLIVGDADEIDADTFKRLSSIAPTVIAKGDSRGDWATITEQLAEAVGKTDAWKQARTTYTETLTKLKTDYAEVIANNTWVHFSLGDGPGQFSIQEPTGSIGNLVVNEVGLKPGSSVPDQKSDAGYSSYPFEQIGSVFGGVTVAIHPLNADGSLVPGIQDVLDNELFTRLPVSTEHHVFGLRTSITDYVTATEWLHELEGSVLAKL